MRYIIKKIDSYSSSKVYIVSPLLGKCISEYVIMWPRTAHFFGFKAIINALKLMNRYY